MMQFAKAGFINVNKKYLIVVFVFIVCTLSFARSFLGLAGIIPWHYGYSDVFNADRINPLNAQKTPYLEVQIEYPVITGFFIYLMWYFGKSLLGYALSTYAFLTIYAVIAAIYLYKFARESDIDGKKIWPFFVFAPSLLVFGVYNWDIIAVMFAVLAIYFFKKEKFLLAALFIGLGFNAKIFPVVFLPFMLLRVDFKKAIKMILVFALVFLALNSYFIINNLDNWKATYTFHSSRDPNIDSIWHLTGLSAVTINLLSSFLFILAYSYFLIRHKRYSILELCLISILLLLLFAKVFSPQYILWLLPFFVILKTNKAAFYSLEILNLIVLFLTLYWMFKGSTNVLLIAISLAVLGRTLILAFVLYIKTVRHKSINS